jgi:hypothetical protein
MDNPELNILLLIDIALSACLRAKKPDWLADVSCDNDADSGEIVFELSDGRTFVVSTSSIRQLD